MNKYNVSKRLRYKGRFISKSAEKFLRKVADSAGIEIEKGKDLTVQFPDLDLVQDLSAQRIVSWAKSSENVSVVPFSAQSQLTSSLAAGGEVRVTIDGVTYEGRQAISALSKYDREQFEANPDGSDFALHKIKTEFKINKSGKLVQFMSIDTAQSEYK